jgi:hypothetical protein
MILAIVIVSNDQKSDKNRIIDGHIDLDGATQWQSEKQEQRKM